MKNGIKKLIFPFVLGLIFTAGFMIAIGDLSGLTLAAPQDCVAGPHTGTLTADETWCKKGYIK
jgi:hypothetical protein